MEMFAKADGFKHPFSGSHRMKLIMSIMQETKDRGGCELNLKKLEADTSVLAYYPLHNERMIKRLEGQWLPLKIHPWDLPIDEIREYFGEKIGIYFEFLGFYTTWLIPLTIAGVCCFVEIVVRLGTEGDYGEAIATGYSVPLFALFTSIWSQLFLEYWKRAEVTKAMEWGQTEFEEEESERPDFEGDFENSHIDGQRHRYFPQAERDKRQKYSAFVIMSMITLVIGLVGIIFYIKFVMVVQSDNSTTNDMGGIVASVANAVQIQVGRLLVLPLCCPPAILSSLLFPVVARPLPRLPVCPGLCSITISCVFLCLSLSFSLCLSLSLSLSLSLPLSLPLSLSLSLCVCVCV